MTEASHCATCGKTPVDSGTGLCPTCLLRTAIEYGAGQALAPLLPKLRYFGDYELLEEIARGGMGVVYRARQVSLDRIVAVKMMRPGLLATEAEIARFRTEAKTAAGLQHPNIVAIHEVGEFDGLHYFSMDFVDGPSLAALVHERPLSSSEAARYVHVLAETVQYAHRRGVLHRDLKPSNVLVDAAGRPRITDFGLARPLEGEAGAASGTVVGTPAYMPPEQAAGEHDRLGAASDVYSLGAILYELLTGRPPFHGATQAETVRLVIGERPAPPRERNAEVSRGLEAVCLRCLEKDPARRYGSAADLAGALEPFMRGGPVRPARRRALWWVAAGAAGLVFLWTVLRTDSRPPARVAPRTQPAPVEVKASAPAPAGKAPAVAVKKSPPPPVPLPLAAGVSPDHGAGYRQTFTFHLSGGQIGVAQINFHGEGAGDCKLFLEPESKRVGLQYDPKGGPGLQVSGNYGTLTRVENSVCSVDLSDVGTSASDGGLDIRLPITFKPEFDGRKEIRASAWDKPGGTRGQERVLGTWTVGASQ